MVRLQIHPRLSLINKNFGGLNMGKDSSKCPIDTTLDSICGKWKTSILLHLTYEEPLRFSDLQKRISDITQRMLTLQLRELEKNDIIERHVYPEVPPRVEYSISEYGKTLIPILAAMREWGENHRKRMQQKESN